ncbi:MAG: phosphoenolpyruvate carboxylase, partial [Akkermansiaceae bacterium]|nr:phosphoenolpyruvate carboxylase [Akkermansiaceae bacterium]
MAALTEALPLDPGFLEQLPWLGEKSDASLPPGQDIPSAQVLSIAFELLNMVEEHVAFRFRAIRRSAHGPGAVRGLWPHMLSEMSAAGCSEEDVLAAFRKIKVEPVLTAHPTEAKRPEVREKHLAIYRRIVEWDSAHDDPPRARRIRTSLQAELEALWFTGEIFVQRPQVKNELLNAIYYLREVFPDVVVRLDRSLEVA